MDFYLFDHTLPVNRFAAEGGAGITVRTPQILSEAVSLGRGEKIELLCDDVVVDIGMETEGAIHGLSREVKVSAALA